MKKYDALFEDEDDIIAGTPQKRYWDILGQIEEDKVHNEFDKIISKIAAMEKMLMEYYPEDDLDDKVKNYIAGEPKIVDAHKKNLYLEYAAKLIFAQND
ncbi:MAG: DUF2018 family protein [Sulfurovum sp.]|nr:DUF2018 family protein [Sulfurovum sp.]